MREITTSFVGGIQRDVTNAMPSESAYYYAENVTLGTDKKGQALYNLNTKLGNKEITLTTDADSYVIPTTAKIIDYIIIQNKDVVVFYKKTGSTGHLIVLLKKLADYTYRPILLYETTDYNIFSIPENYPLRKTLISRYENQEVIKIYWSIIESKKRFFLDIAPVAKEDPNISNSYRNVRSRNISMLLAIPPASLNPPQFLGYTSGKLKAGVIMYAYRLYNVKGNRSYFSPATPLIPLSNSPTNSLRHLKGQDTAGQILDEEEGVGVSAKKGVNLKININSADLAAYNRIELVSIWYSKYRGMPDITICYRGALTSVLNITDTGTNVYGTIELEEFFNFSEDFAYGTAIAKDNILFAGNIEQTKFDIDEVLGYYWDARAYKHNDFGVARVYNISGDYYTGTNGNWTKKAANGDTLGTASSVEEFWDCIANQEQTLSGLPDYGYTADGTTQGAEGPNIRITYNSTYYKIGGNSFVEGWPSYLNLEITPGDTRDFILGLKRSWQPDETYRFGIVFIDSFGRESFVKWVTDLTIPYDASTAYSTVDGTMAVVKIPHFQVNNLPVGFSYRIVYVRREEQDKTIHSEGPIHVGYIAHDDELYTTYGYQYNGVLGLSTASFTAYISPEVLFDKSYTFHEGDHLKLLYLGTGGDIVDTSPGESVVENNIRRIVKLTNTDFIPDSIEISFTEALLYVDNGYPATIGVFNKELTNKVVKTRASGEDYHYGRIGTRVFFNNRLAPDSLYNTRVLVCRLVRSSTGQYGGQTLAAKLNNEYIVAGDINNPNAFYGDNFFGFWDMTTTMWNSETATSRNIHESLMLPLNSTMNPYLRHDDHMAKLIAKYGVLAFSRQEYSVNSIDTSSIDDAWSDLYIYNKVYSEPRSERRFFPKPLDLSMNNTYPHMIKYSDTKMNNEEVDSWLIFRSNNYNEVDTSYDEIRRLVEFNNQVIVFQDKGIAIAAINLTEQLSGTGGPLLLGRGTTLSHFQYVTTDFGLLPKSDVLKSYATIYFLGSNKKLYTFNEGFKSLGELSGITDIIQNAVTEDTTFTGAYEPESAEVEMIFSNPLNDSNFTASYVSGNICTLVGKIDHLRFIKGSVYQMGTNNNTYRYLGRINDNTIQVEMVDAPPLSGVVSLRPYMTVFNNFSISFSEHLNGFISFNTFYPKLLQGYNEKLLTVRNNKFYVSREGKHSIYYDAYQDSLVEVRYATNGKNPKDFPTFSTIMEVWDKNEYVPNRTFYAIRAFNNLQTSENLVLYPHSDVRYQLDLSGEPLTKPTTDHSTLSNCREVNKKWKFVVPRMYQDDTTNRMLDNHMVLRMEIRNYESYKYSMHAPTLIVRDFNH